MRRFAEPWFAVFRGGPLDDSGMLVDSFAIYRDATGAAFRGLGLKGIIGVGCEVEGIYVLSEDGYVWVWAGRDGRRADEIARTKALEKKQEEQVVSAGSTK